MNTFAQTIRLSRVDKNSSPSSLLIQRKCDCGGIAKLAGQCSACENNKLLGIQPKLSIGASNDVYEREADRVADEVVRIPYGGEKIADKFLKVKPLVQRRVSDTQNDTNSAPTLVQEVLRSSGQPLDQSTRDYMESRFGSDFTKVRIHNDRTAHQSAKLLNAHAYTAGQNVVFGIKAFSPTTNKGRRLLAHELTHVIQQNGNRANNFIQRAEVDDRSCAGLADIETDIDTKVNTEISGARSAAATPLVVPDFLKDVSKRLGGTFVGSIEEFIQKMSTTKRTDPPKNLSGTKFAGVDNVNFFFNLQTNPFKSVKVVGPAANIKNICVGADKLGHFFGEGFVYFQIANASGGGATGTANAESTGRLLEISKIQGLGVTGVFSNADLAANLAGKKFYEDIQANPSGFSFKIGNYVTDKWNEATNPSFYGSAEASVIWSNLLSGTWAGAFTSGGPSSTSKPIDAKVNLTATTSGSLTGTNEWPAGAAKPNKEKISNGKISQRTTPVSGANPLGLPQLPATGSATPVSGVTIDFDWALRTRSGKGKWESIDEQNLVGTWGIGSSVTNGGVWKLKKT